MVISLQKSGVGFQQISIHRKIYAYITADLNRFIFFEIKNEMKFLTDEVKSCNKMVSNKKKSSICEYLFNKKLWLILKFLLR